MKRLLLILAMLWCLPAFGATYTVSWCKVKPGVGFIGGAAYEVCVGNTVNDCQLGFAWSWTPSQSVTLPDNVNAWVQVRAIALTTAGDSITSAYSNPVQIIAGLTPPAIGGCP